MSPLVRSARAAAVFLTRIPVGGHPFTPVEWAAAPAFFPLVGLALGAVLSLVHWAFWPLGSLADAAVVIGVSLALTGALHEDGLADTSDALGGATNREQIFEILKDSRVGSFGAAALVISLLCRVTLVDRLGPSAAWALPLVQCAARVGPVWQMAFLPYASRVAAKSAHLAPTRPAHALAATAWLMVASGVAVFAHFTTLARIAAMAVALAATTFVTARYYAARAAGVTGDFLGATEQLSEVASYAVLAWGVA